MGKISIFTRKDTGDKRYILNLPKALMESLVITKGDELNFTGELGGEFRFKLRRKSEIDNFKIQQKQKELDDLKNGN